MCFKQQKYSEAEALLREVLEHERKEPAAEIYIPILDMPIPPELEAAFAELNTALSSEESVAWYAARDAEQQKKRQKDGKLVVAATLYNLACVCECMKQYEEAETLLREALTLRRDVLGAEHAQTQRVIETLQGVLQKRLIAAAEQGEADTFASFFHGEAKPKDKPHTKTALIWAAKHGYTNLVKALLQRGERIEAKDWKGRTALIWAAHEGHSEVVKALLSDGADVEVKDYWGRTAFLTAVHQLIRECSERDRLKYMFDRYREGSISEVVALIVRCANIRSVIYDLIEQRIDLEQCDNDGCTALMTAQYPTSDFDEVVEFLIAYGADVNAKDNAEISVLSYGAGYGAGNGANHVKRDMLLKAGAKWTLHAACAWRDAEAIRACIADGAELDTSRHKYIIQNTLLFALREEHVDIARWFAERTDEIDSNLQASFKQLVEATQNNQTQNPDIAALMRDISHRLGMR